MSKLTNNVLLYVCFHSLKTPNIVHTFLFLIQLFLTFYFVLGYSLFTMLWHFQMNSKGTQPYKHMHTFFPILFMLRCFNRVRLFVTHGLQPTRLLVHGILQARVLEWCHCLLQRSMRHCSYYKNYARWSKWKVNEALSFGSTTIILTVAMVPVPSWSRGDWTEKDTRQHIINIKCSLAQILRAGAGGFS